MYTYTHNTDSSVCPRNTKSPSFPKSTYLTLIPQNDSESYREDYNFQLKKLGKPSGSRNKNIPRVTFHLSSFKTKRPKKVYYETMKI